MLVTLGVAQNLQDGWLAGGAPLAAPRVVKLETLGKMG